MKNELTGMPLYPDEVRLFGDVICGCGNPWPCPESVEPGSSYDTGPGSCWSTHAEINALTEASRIERKQATMYVSTEPCLGCLKIIACSGVVKVIWPGGKLDFPFLSCYQLASRRDWLPLIPQLPRLKEV